MNLHLRTSFENIRRAPFQAMAAISVLAITFFISTLLAILVYASNQLLVYFETRPQIIAFLKDETGQEEVNKLRARLERDERVEVSSVVYVSKEGAYELYKDATSENPLLGELVSPSIFPASIEFSASDLLFAQALIDEISKEDVVEDIGFTASLGGGTATSDVIGRIKSITFYIRVGGITSIVALGVTSFLVLMVVIGMRTTMKRKEIESLSLIGATPWFIRAPIVLEAIHYCLTGAFLGFLFASVLVMYAAPSILSYFKEVPVLPKDTVLFFGMLGIILGVEVAAGIIIAISGSLIAVSRSLRTVKT